MGQLAIVMCIELALGSACGSSLEPEHDSATPKEAGAVDSPRWETDGDRPSDASADLSVGSGGDATPERGTNPSSDVGSPEGGADMSIESISLSQAGNARAFKTTLVAGALYLLKAAGTVAVGTHRQDAEFDIAPDQAAGADTVSGVDVGIDVGLLELHPMNHTTIVPPGPGRMKWYGSVRSDHTYYMCVTGAGKPLTLELVTSGAMGAGAIAVSLFELGPMPPPVYESMPAPLPPPPAPPKIGRAVLETVQVSLTKTVVAAHVATDATAIYLLQASAVAQVSRGTITPDRQHMGDAEYMDWPADGTRFNDGECGADFGIGVDEVAGPAPCTSGATYTHRKNWWGPYRNDHVYYMLYGGTGKPISFLYYDSGYGDNSMTDTVTVRMFQVP